MNVKRAVLGCQLNFLCSYVLAMCNEYSVPWRWWWLFLGYTGKTEADERTVATHMLMEAWKADAEYQEDDHYHWINNTGCLSVEEIQAIARQVWR